MDPEDKDYGGTNPDEYMMYDESDYPYEYEELPELPELIKKLDWDVLCLFDACRWDAFEGVCNDAEPAQIYKPHTTEWIREVWCESDYDWSDVTYISGNLLTGDLEVAGIDEELSDHVDEHVKGWENPDVKHFTSASTLPAELTDVVNNYSPPIVVHYFQPHNPFIGKAKLGVSLPFSKLATNIEDPDTGSYESQLVKEGHVSLEYYRLAYLENLRLVWNASEFIRKKYDKVITSADHGEGLGPNDEDFGHGSGLNQGMSVPFHTNWDVDLEDPQKYGAEPGRDWMLAENRNTDQSERAEQNDGEETIDDDVEVSEDVKEKLKMLGYQDML